MYKLFKKQDCTLKPIIKNFNDILNKLKSEFPFFKIMSFGTNF